MHASVLAWTPTSAFAPPSPSPRVDTIRVDLTGLLLGSAGHPSIQLCTLCPTKSPFFLIDAVPKEPIMHLLNRPFSSSINFCVIVEQYSSASALHGSQSPFMHILVAATAEKQVSGRSWQNGRAEETARTELAAAAGKCKRAGSYYCVNEAWCVSDGAWLRRC
jgi:NADH:ubiquinone oxidoreductase subunit